MTDGSLIGRSSRRSLAEAAIGIIWPKASASFGIVLGSYLEKQHRTDSGLFVFVTHPIAGSVLRESACRVFSGDAETFCRTWTRRKYLPIVSDLMDGVIAWRLLARLRRKLDVVFTAGLNLGLAAILLRRLGLVDRVAFVIMDYWPRKYRSGLLSWLYRKLYGWCCTRVDMVVDVAATVEEARRRDGIRVPPQRRIFSPHPVDVSQAKTCPQTALKTDAVLWVGAITPECGFELVVDAIAVAARRRPNIVVEITSYLPFPESVWQQIRGRGLERHFRFLGYFEDEEVFNDIVCRYRAGLAPYAPDTLSVKRYAGVARPWTYMANGVPPIITRVPPDVGEIETAGAGLVIDYDAEQLAGAMIKLLTDDQFHARCREGGLALARGRAPDVVFDGLLKRLGIHLDPARVAAQSEAGTEDRVL